MSEKNKKKGLSKALKIFYGVGDCGFTLMSNIESYYFNFFLTNLAQFSLPMVCVAVVTLMHRCPVDRCVLTA